VALAGACLLSGAAQAAWLIDVASTSTVELTFMAWENNTAGLAPKVVFVKDLGVTMATFFASAQVDTGTQMYWYLGGSGASSDDANWTTFLSTDLGGGTTPDIAKVKWAVFAYAEPNASPAPGGVQLYTTNLQDVSGNAAVIPGISNVTSDSLTNISASMTNFMGGNANTGTLGSATNGSGIIKSTDGDTKYPWGPLIGLGSGDQVVYSGKFPHGAGNLVGKSSWFYYVTGSNEFDGTLPVQIDEFDNLTNDGYWGLAAASAADKAGEYFLSYNLNGTVTALEARSGILASNNFARLAGVLSLSSSAGKSQTVLSMTESFLRGFSKVAATLPSAAGEDLAHALAGDGALDVSSPSAVPEASSGMLIGAGLALLAGLQLRRRRAHAHR
jgi:hypothetical protein